MQKKYIDELIKLAKKAQKHLETPISALVVYNGKIISKAYNTRNKTNKTIDHAEIKAITLANKKLKTWRLNKCTLYVTIEPCDMCKNVIKESRIDQVYYILSRNEYKKIYNKTNFNKLKFNDPEIQKKIQNYQQINQEFWQKLR